MNFENIISFGLGAVAINVTLPKAEIQTPLQDMFNASDIHEIIIGAIKVIIAGILSVGVAKLLKAFSNRKEA